MVGFKVGCIWYEIVLLHFYIPFFQQLPII